MKLRSFGKNKHSSGIDLYLTMEWAFLSQVKKGYNSRLWLSALYLKPGSFSIILLLLWVSWSYVFTPNFSNLMTMEVMLLPMSDDICEMLFPSWYNFKR